MPSSFPVSCAQPNCATHAFLFLFIKLWILAKFIADYMDILAYFIVKHYKMTRNDSLLHNISIFLIDQGNYNRVLSQSMFAKYRYGNHNPTYLSLRPSRHIASHDTGCVQSVI